MAKICPIDGEKVIYLFCQECEDKQCRFPSANDAPPQEPREEEERE